MTKPSVPRGIAVEIDTSREKPNSLPSLITALAATAGAAFAVCSALELSGVLTAVCGAIAVVIEWICARKRTVFVCLNVAILALTAALSFAFADSFAALANRTFELSEKYQMYVYTRFPTSNSTETAAVLTVFAAVGACMGLASVCRIRSVFVGIFAIFVGFAVYFGLFPTAPPTLIFCLSVLVATMCRGRGGAVAAVVILITAAIGLALFPGENADMRNFTEDIRDRFGEQLILPDSGTQSDENPPDMSFLVLNPNNFGDIPDLRAETGDNFSGSTLGAAQSQKIRVWMVVLMTALIAAAVGFPIFRAYMGERRRRKAFESDDIAVAVDAMFRASLKRLAAVGLQRRNTPTVELADEVASLVDGDYRAAYVEAANLRDEALYSDHPLDESHRARMRDFMELTELKLRRRMGFGKRAALRLGLSGGVR